MDLILIFDRPETGADDAAPITSKAYGVWPILLGEARDSAR